MQASAKPNAADDRRDFVVIPSDQVRVAPSDAEITDLLRAAARQHSEAGVRADPATPVPVPAVDATFRATAVEADVPDRGSSFGGRVIRVLATLVLATGLALCWQLFGYAAKNAASRLLPQIAQMTSLPLDKLGLGPSPQPSDTPDNAAPAQADASALAATDPAATDPGASANIAAAAPAPSSDATQQLQSMARDLASANQQIETLKAGIAELKASQQQMSRDLAKAASDRAAEQAARAKAAAARKLVPPPYSPTTATAGPPGAYRPSPSAYSAQAAAPQSSPQTAQPYVPQPPIQLQPQADPGLPATALRPPLPVQ